MKRRALIFATLLAAVVPPAASAQETPCSGGSPLAVCAHHVTVETRGAFPIVQTSRLASPGDGPRAGLCDRMPFPMPADTTSMTSGKRSRWILYGVAGAGTAVATVVVFRIVSDSVGKLLLSVISLSID